MVPADTDRHVIVHLTTVDMSLAYLLLPQLVAFRDAGYDVVGVSAPGPYVEALQREGIEHVALQRSTRATNLRDDLAAAREFAGICRRLQPDIVHTHNPKPGVYGRVMARIVGVPVVVNTVHGLYAQATDPLIRRLAVYSLERFAACFSQAEFVQNPEDVATLARLRVPASKLHLLGNGIDLERFTPDGDGSVRLCVRRELGLGDGEVVVGAVGRLVAEKGYRELFTVIEHLHHSHPTVRFVIVGPEDPQKGDAVPGDVIERLRERYGVIFLGFRDDVDHLYRAMDVFVLPSHREGFPRSAMEAAASGLPIVTTDVRGCRQVVDDGLTGRLVPVRDAARLGDALIELVDDPPLRQRMGEASYRKARQEFDHQRQIDLTLEVYERLLSRRRSHRRHRAS